MSALGYRSGFYAGLPASSLAFLQPILHAADRVVRKTPMDARRLLWHGSWLDDLSLGFPDLRK